MKTNFKLLALTAAVGVVLSNVVVAADDAAALEKKIAASLNPKNLEVMKEKRAVVAEKQELKRENNRLVAEVTAQIKGKNEEISSAKASGSYEEVKKLEAELVSLEARKYSLEKRKEEIATEITEAKKAAKDERNNTKYVTRLVTLALDVDQNKTDIEELQAAADNNDELIAENTVDIAKNEVDISQNKLDIAHNSARIDKLNKDLKRGLATQAALSGLFQPYSVGKFNVTAAVGGYKSEVALAVGTGYRFNEKLATKAGVAFNKGGVSYNVGVNYEF